MSSNKKLDRGEYTIEKFDENSKKYSKEPYKDDKKSKFINKIFKLATKFIKTLFLRIFGTKILLILWSVLMVIVWLVVIIILPILIIISLSKTPSFLIEQWIPIIINVVKDKLGNITGISITDLPGVKITSISWYKFIKDWVSTEDKWQLLKNLSNMLFIQTKWIKSNIGLDDLFGKYQASLWEQALDMLLFFKENKDKNFEDIKKAMETIYTLKYNRRQSDYFIFDYIETKDKYSTYFNPTLEKEIIDNLKFTDWTNSFDSLKKSRYEWIWYYVPAHWSGTVANLVPLKSKDQIATATGWTLVEYTINWLSYDTSKMLEFFYVKNTLSDYLKVYGSDLNDNSNNDLIAWAKVENDANITSKTIDKDKIDWLKALLKVKEDEFINSIYELNKDKLKVTWIQSNIEINKLILKRVFDKKYNVYVKIVSDWILFTLSTMWKIAEPNIDYKICRITQLYWQSNASPKYPAWLHNGYDFVFQTANWSRTVPVRSMIDWTVIISRSGNEVGNQVVVKWNVASKTPDGREVYPIIEYLHLESRNVSEWAKVSIWQQLWIQWNTWNSWWTHLHISLFISWVSDQCSGNLNSSHWYNCGTTASKFFWAYWYENLFTTTGCTYVKSSWAWSIW